MKYIKMDSEKLTEEFTRLLSVYIPKEYKGKITNVRVNDVDDYPDSVPCPVGRKQYDVFFCVDDIRNYENKEEDIYASAILRVSLAHMQYDFKTDIMYGFYEVETCSKLDGIISDDIFERLPVLSRSCWLDMTLDIF